MVLNVINPFYEKLAKVAVNYSLQIKKGDRVFITGPTLAKELFQAMYVEVIKIGGFPLLNPQIEGIQELYYKYASEEQLEYIDDIQFSVLKEFDHYIILFGNYNTRKLSLVDPKKLAKSQGSTRQRELIKILEERMSNKELGYLIIPFICNALAQESDMDLFSYSKFVSKALFLDKEDPVKDWLKFERKQEEIIKYLSRVDIIQVIGEDTDLKLSVKERIWENDCGHKNLPAGEVATSPVEDSVEGKIRFTYPGIYQGREIENIYFEFKDGKVIKATASKGEDLLKEILKIENADILGEFAVATNYGITKFTKNMLFDEKIGGTIHCALGLGFKEWGSKNESAIHWDILKDMKIVGSQILADGEMIYEEGQWKI